MTSSPWPIFKALKDRMRASVPELHETLCLDPIKLENFASSSPTFSPRIYCPDLRIFNTFLSTSFEINSYCSLKSNILIFLFIIALISM